MRLDKKPFSAISHFSSFDKAYQSQDARLTPFLRDWPSNESLLSCANDKNGQQALDRNLLHDVLTDQLKDIEGLSELMKSNLDALLDDKTYTVCTAHQPCLLTGPSYFIYKIVSTIKLAHNLSSEWPDKHVVPLFIIGGEDHDFEETNHMHLFGQTFTWEDHQGGPVGRYNVASMKPLLEDIKSKLGDSVGGKKLQEIIELSYEKLPTQREALVQFLTYLFADYGLLILSMDDKRLKRAFTPIIKDELLAQNAQKIVQNQQIKLKEAGFNPQAFVRPINLFYVNGKSRQRIQWDEENEYYQVIDTDLQFTKDEILSILEEHPDRFSPNVILRPLFQELILPNIAYVGGGGELAYWTDRKPLFEFYDINFPLLIRRDSVLWLNKSTQKRMAKVNLELDHLLQPVEDLVKSFVIDQHDEDVQFHHDEEAIAAALANISQRIEKIDSTLVRKLEAEKQKFFNSLESLEKRVVKSLKAKNDVEVGRIRKVYDQVYPAGKLQERYDNFMANYISSEGTFIEHLYEHLDPLDRHFKIIYE